MRHTIPLTLLALLVLFPGPLASPTLAQEALPAVGVVTHQVDDATFRAVRNLGTRHVRYTLYWRIMEPSPGRYDPIHLEFWDALAKRAERHGIELLIVVHSPPPHVKKGDYRAFARFLGAMAARYPSITAWQVGNEWDTVPQFGDWFTEGSFRARGRAYAGLLREVYPAIKRANPRARVVVGGIAEHPTEFVRGIYEGRGRFDVLAMHSYGVPLVEASLIPKVRALREALDAVNARPEIWLTEFGMSGGQIVHVQGAPHTWRAREPDGEAFDRLQLEAWRDLILWNERERVFTRVYGYAIRQGNELGRERLQREARLPRGRTEADYGFGLLRRDGSERPAYRWLREHLRRRS